MPILTGYVGHGTAFAGGVLAEPTDAGYARLPVTFGDLNPYGPAPNQAGGSIGPAVAGFGTLAFGGLFDAATGGNLLAYWPLVAGITVGAGQNYVLNPGGLRITLNDAPGVLARGSAFYPAGAILGRMGSAQILTAGCPVQIISGVLSASGASNAFVQAVPASGAAQTILTGSTTQMRVEDITMSAACTFSIGAPGGSPFQRVELFIRQPSSGGFAVTWPSGIIWTIGTAPTVSTTAGSISRYVFETDDAGAHWLGSY